MPKVSATPSQRFWAKVREEGDCWVWTAYVDKSNGYGKFQLGGANVYAHRFAYEDMIADIPAGLQIDHLCRNRICVNPYHLEPVTPLVNTRRSPIGHASKTHCPQGHAYSGDNLRVWSGRRYCRTCQAENSKAFRERQSA